MRFLLLLLFVSGLAIAKQRDIKLIGMWDNIIIVHYNQKSYHVKINEKIADTGMFIESVEVKYPSKSVVTLSDGSILEWHVPKMPSRDQDPLIERESVETQPCTTKKCLRAKDELIDKLKDQINEQQENIENNNNSSEEEDEQGSEYFVGDVE